MRSMRGVETSASWHVAPLAAPAIAPVSEGRQDDDALAAQYRETIALAFPSLAVENVRRLGEGWDSSVWEVDGSLVFRFPKRDDVVPWLEREIKLLPELQSAL